MSSTSSDEEEDSDVFYSCDSDYIANSASSNTSSPLRGAVSKSSLDNFTHESDKATEADSADPITLNIYRKLSISQPPPLASSSSSSVLSGSSVLSSSSILSSSSSSSHSSDSTKVRFAEHNITYDLSAYPASDEEEEGEEGEKENKKVGVELKKVFTKIITKAEEVQKTVVSKMERKKDESTNGSRSVPTPSPSRWFKDLIGPSRPAPSSWSKNAVATFVRRKSKREFGSLVCVQTLDMHDGAIWTMKFSFDGTLMASGGQDCLLRLWKVNTDKLFTGQPEFAYFQKPPAHVFHGHNGDILDISWSKTDKRILSASMDRTVRLWQLDQEECVHSFQHIVTSVIFHPTDDNLFLSGSLDNKLMLWNIEKRSVVHTVDTHEFITTVSFTLDGKLAVAGLHSGMCTFFDVENFTLAGKLYVHSSRGKNKKGKKISGIEALPDGKNILITSNDSRIRLYRLDDFSCECKYKGLVNNTFQIKATCNSSGDYIICGSEDNMVYIWNTQNDCTMFSPADNIPIIGASSRRDINSSYECFTTNTKQPAVVTVSLFSPHLPANGTIRHRPTTPQTPPPSSSPQNTPLKDSTNAVLRPPTPTPLSSSAVLPPPTTSTAPATSPALTPPKTTTSPSTPIPPPATPSKKSPPQTSSPPSKTLSHRNSISNFINLITTSSKGSSHKSNSLPSPHHGSSHPHLSNSQSQILPPSQLSHNKKEQTPSLDGTSTQPSTLSSHSDSSYFSTSPQSTKKMGKEIKEGKDGKEGKEGRESGSLASIFTGMELLVEDQLMYIITADATGQIKVFENFPPLSPPLSPSHSPTSSFSPVQPFAPSTQTT